MTKKILIFLFLLTQGFINAEAQELNCSVSVNSSKIQMSDKRIFETLQKSVMEFINNRHWTDRTFKQIEKIECSIMITINSYDMVDKFTGSIQVQARRPVFNSSYNSILINYLDDKFDFTYVETSPLDFQEGAFTSNLSSVLAFYSYIIIGLDFDTYSERGGVPYFTIAQNIVSSSQNASESGWKSYESQKNRYWIVENLLNSSYDDLHLFLYRYHRHGLDVMYDKVQQGRTEILADLKYLQNVFRNKPGLFILNIVMEAKRDELVSIFSQSNANEKQQASVILKQVDPAHSGDYQNMLTAGQGK